MDESVCSEAGNVVHTGERDGCFTLPTNGDLPVSEVKSKHWQPVCLDAAEERRGREAKCRGVRTQLLLERVGGRGRVLAAPFSRDKQFDTGSVSSANELGLEGYALRSGSGDQDVDALECGGGILGGDIEWDNGNAPCNELLVALVVLGFLQDACR
jgi:hypothetical protein